MLDAVNDKSTFMFTLSANAVVEQAKTFIEQRIRQARAPGAPTRDAGVTGELLKLIEVRGQGFLSAEVFATAEQLPLSR